MKVVITSAAITFLIVFVVFHFVSDGTVFWSAKVDSPVRTTIDASSATVNFAHEPGVQNAKKPEGEAREPASMGAAKASQVSEMQVVLRKAEEPSKKAQGFEKQPEPETSPVVRTPKVGDYSVQVAAFKTESEANEKMVFVKNAGFNSYVESRMIKGTKYYRVKVGPVSTRSEAEQLKSKVLAIDGVNDALVRKSID